MQKRGVLILGIVVFSILFASCELIGEAYLYPPGEEHTIYNLANGISSSLAGSEGYFFIVPDTVSTNLDLALSNLSFSLNFRGDATLKESEFLSQYPSQPEFSIYIKNYNELPSQTNAIIKIYEVLDEIYPNKIEVIISSNDETKLINAIYKLSQFRARQLEFSHSCVEIDQNTITPCSTPTIPNAYQVSGVLTPDATGTYTRNGNHLGKPAYENPNGYWLFYSIIPGSPPIYAWVIHQGKGMTIDWEGTNTWQKTLTTDIPPAGSFSPLTDIGMLPLATGTASISIYTPPPQTPDIKVTGTAAAGNYYENGVHNGEPAYEREDGAYWIVKTSSYAIRSGSVDGPDEWLNPTDEIAGEYDGVGANAGTTALVETTQPRQEDPDYYVLQIPGEPLPDPDCTGNYFRKEDYLGNPAFQSENEQYWLYIDADPIEPHWTIIQDTQPSWDPLHRPHWQIESFSADPTPRGHYTANTQATGRVYVSDSPNYCTITEDPEVTCWDGEDNDCDGDIDCDDTDCFIDLDGDGDGDWALAPCGGDCDDTNPLVNSLPETVEDCSDDLDNDCDEGEVGGGTDCKDSECGDGTDCSGGNEDFICCNGECEPDLDGDGFYATTCGGYDNDCDERDNPTRCPTNPWECDETTSTCPFCNNPQSREYCNDRINNDCDSQTDEPPCGGKLSYYVEGTITPDATGAYYTYVDAIGEQIYHNNHPVYQHRNDEFYLSFSARHFLDPKDDKVWTLSTNSPTLGPELSYSWQRNPEIDTQTPKGPKAPQGSYPRNPYSINRATGTAIITDRSCGNKICDINEKATSAACGNRKDCVVCPYDCLGTCGDTLCNEAHWENPESCLEGNNKCEDDCCTNRECPEESGLIISLVDSETASVTCWVDNKGDIEQMFPHPPSEEARADFILTQRDGTVHRKENILVRWDSRVSATFNNVLKPDTYPLTCSITLYDVAPSTMSEHDIWLLKTCTYEHSIDDLDLDCKGINVGDCDDWPYDDSNPGQMYNCPSHEEVFEGSADIEGETACLKSPTTRIIDYEFQGKTYTDLVELCYEDFNNDGIGDFATCSYCRNQAMPEVCDNIDNNCGGKCQGSPTGGYEYCGVEEYQGDGADDPEGCNTYFNPLLDQHFPMANDFGVRDTFCQMVDEDVSYTIINAQLKEETAVCGGYNRCVKWGKEPKRLLTSEPLGPNGVMTLDTYQNLVFYKPGGVRYTEGDQALCGKYKIEELKLTAAKESNTKSVTAIEEYLTTSEAIGKTRKTNIDDPATPEDESDNSAVFPEHFIDSMRGACDFDEFWKDYKDTVQRKQGGEYVWEWKTACVPKDKCDDYADNDGKEDLRQAAPYGSFLKDEVLMDYHKNQQLTRSHQPIDIRLIDVDDPQCKFDQLTSASPLPPRYVEDDYKDNPKKGFKFCNDGDGDGFCGYELVTLNPEAKCVEWEHQIVLTGNPGQEYDFQNTCVRYVESKTFARLDQAPNKFYSVSPQFPDCDDDTSDDEDQYKIYKADGSEGPLLVTTALGWPEAYEGDLWSAWNVHPLTYLTRANCDLHFYDMDCNKDNTINLFELLKEKGLEPSNILPTQVGIGKPFDVDPSTGIETIKVDSIREDRDIICTTFNPGLEELGVLAEKGAKTTIGMGVGVLVVSVVSATAPVTVTTGLMVGGTALLAGSLGYDIADYGRDVMDGKAKIIDWQNPDWKIYPITVKAITLGVSMFAMSRTAIANQPIKHIKKQIGVEMKGIGARIKSVANGAINRVKSIVKMANARHGCFLEDTKILLEDGTYKNIQDIQEGDQVMAYDLETQEPVSAEVTTTFVRDETDYRIIEYEVIEE